MFFWDRVYNEVMWVLRQADLAYLWLRCAAAIAIGPAKT